MPRLTTITDKAADKLTAPESGQVDHFDGAYPGLALRVSKGGRKAWVFMYRHGGKLRRMTLDPYPAMRVSEAHDAWRHARTILQKGLDPAKERKKPPPSPTDFKSVAEDWLRRDQADKRSRHITARILEREVFPTWEHCQITEITKRDALDIIDGIVDRGHNTQARRVHAILHRLFRWAIGREIVEKNPLAGSAKPGSETKRKRVLSDTEIIKVWHAADMLGWPYGPAFQLLLLTGSRREEIGQLRKDEVVGDVIHLEGERTKSDAAHVIPLSTAARNVLDGLPDIAGRFVFTHTGKAHLQGWGEAKAKLDKLSGVTDWRTHDLRRTVATGLQKLGVALQVTESVLGHVSGSRAGIIGVYQTHDYATEKRAALEAWGARVMALVEGSQPGKVLPMRGR